MLGILLRGWLVLVLASVLTLYLVSMDRPVLAIIAGGVTGVVGFRYVAPKGLSAVALVVLIGIVSALQVGLLETRLRLTDSAVVETSGLVVRHDLMRTQAAERGTGPNRQAIHRQVAAVVPSAWVPGEPIPYWVVRTLPQGQRHPPLGEREWQEPTPRALLAPVFGTGSMPGLIAALAEDRGLPPPSNPVLIRWTEDAEASVAAMRRNIGLSLLAGLGFWAVIVVLGAGITAKRRKPG